MTLCDSVFISLRLLSLQSENVSLKSEHGQCAAHLSDQTEALRGSFREQMRHLQDEHCRTVETLQQQVSRLETQMFQLQKEPVGAGKRRSPEDQITPAAAAGLQPSLCLRRRGAAASGQEESGGQEASGRSSGGPAGRSRGGRGHGDH